MKERALAWFKPDCGKASEGIWIRYGSVEKTGGARERRGLEETFSTDSLKGSIEERKGRTWEEVYKSFLKQKEMSR